MNAHRALSLVLLHPMSWLGPRGRKRTLVGVVALGLAMVDGRAVAETEATYALEFAGLWSEASHPTDFPDAPHFSGLIGTTHTEAFSIFEVGQFASQGVQNVAERGQRNVLGQDIEQGIADGIAWSKFSRPGLSPSPSSRVEELKVRESFPLVSIISMLAPSPDWFVGVSALDLRAGDEWADAIHINLYPLDAGTDSGVTFESSNQVTSPVEPIAELDTFPFAGTPAVASFSFVLQHVGPYVPFVPGDPDADFNRDGVIDGSDYLVWQANFGTRLGGSTETGDADMDGDVDGNDFLIWQAAFNPSGAADAGVSLVPEPATGLLSVTMLLLIPWRTR